MHRSRLRRVVTWTVAIMLLAAAGGYYYISRPERLAAIAGGLLEQITGAEAHIDSASISFNGTINLTGVRLTVPTVSGQGGELFAAEQVMMRVDLGEVLRGEFIAEQMILVRPVIWLTEVAEGEFNFELLRRLRKRQIEDDPFIQLPRAHVREGRLRYGEVHDGRYQMTGELLLAGGLTPDAESGGVYSFEMFQYTAGNPDAASGPTLRGSLDMARLEVKAELADFAFIDPHRNMLPRQIRAWWDLFEPSGSLPNIKFDYDPKLGPQGEVRLDGLSLTLPQLSAADYKARMTGVRGSFRFDSEKIEITNLVGQIEGLEYRINGTIFGYSADAPFHLALDTKPFRIPEKPQYMVAFPVPVQKGFRMLTPVGWLRVSVAAVRQKPGGEVAYQGSATILSGRDVLTELIGDAPREQWPAIIGDLHPDSPELVSKGMYFKFPYELSHCRGKLTFNSDLITVNNLTGNTPSGGTATIEGTIGPPGEDAAVDLTVTAVDIHFDHTLRAALPPDQQRYLGMFFHEESYQRLLEAGHFVTSDEHQADELTRLDLNRRIAELTRLGRTDAVEALQSELTVVKERLGKPVFDLAGRGNVLVKIHRPPGADQPIDLHTAIDLAGINVVFEHFPYPVRVKKGRLLIAPNRVEFDSVSADGLHGGSGSLTGTIRYGMETGDGGALPELTLKASGLPVGPLLYDALAPPRDQWLRSMRVTGLIDVHGRIFRSDQRDFDLAVDVKLRDGTARPGGGDYELTGLTAELTLGLQGVTLKRIAGRHGESRITLSGSADWSDPAATHMKIAAKASNLRFEDAVLDLISPASQATAVRELWALRQPAGVFDAEATYEVRGEAEPAFDLTLRPKSLSFLHDDERISLAAMSGAARLEPGVLRLDDLAGDYDGGRLQLAGRIDTAGALRAELAVRASGERFTPTLRRALPAAVGDVVSTLQLDGKYDLTIPRLVYEPGADASAQVGFNATLRLANGSGRLGLPFDGFDGLIELTAGPDADASAGDTKPRLEVMVTAERVRLAGRVIEQLRLPVRTAADSSNLLIPEFSGRCYGGMIGGSGAMSLDTGDYHLQLALAGASLAQLSAPAEHPAAAPKADDQPMIGTVSAALSIEGNLRDAARLRGRGDILVRDGDFVGVPLSMGLLQVTHLQLPGATRFQRAAVTYNLRDGRAVFERVELDAPNMRLTGTGAVHYDSGALDVTLTTSNPNGLDLGPITALINRVRDQLVTLRIVGTLDKPEVRVRQFNGITQAWEDVFGHAGVAPTIE